MGFEAGTGCESALCLRKCELVIRGHVGVRVVVCRVLVRSCADDVNFELNGLRLTRGHD